MTSAFATAERVLQRTQPFLPEELTPLAFTPIYASLTADQQRRYNQLQGLYFNEQIAFFEEGVGGRFLPALLADRALASMHETLREFAAEERRHTAMFRGMNRRAAPHLYGHQDHFFIRVPRVLGALLNWMTARPRWFPLFLWLMLLQEERSLYYSREILRHEQELQPAFAAVHRAHLADEEDHVDWDEQLLDLLWVTASPALRRANAALFGFMLREFFYTPKRGQLRVLDQLVCECPELQPSLPELRRQLLALGQDQSYRTTLYSRRIVPRVFTRFDRCPEFAPVLRMLEVGR